MPEPTANVLDEDRHALITISGPPASGATTVASAVADALGYDYVNGGEMFRELANERGLTLNQLIAEAQSNDTLDRSLDARIRRIIDQHAFETTGLVIESRLAGWVAGEDADFKVWLDAPIETRVARTDEREEDESEMRVRQESEANRYEAYYDIDVENTKFYDLQVNTARWRPELVQELVLTAIREYRAEDDEGPFTKSLDPRPADEGSRTS